MLRFVIVLLLILLAGNATTGQIPITFFAADSLEITADLYEMDNSYPYIILCHQARSSRGEYREIAKKLNKLNFNCLAVDLRSGNESSYVTNETAMRARHAGLSTTFLDAEKDMKAAIDHIAARNDHKIILFGSSYSASLALKIAKEDDRIEAVVAFSPGEYFGYDLKVKNAIAGLKKPVFVASPKNEEKYLKEIMAGVPNIHKELFVPAKGGKHGVKTLYDDCEQSSEYWFRLFKFLQKLKT